MVHLHSRFFVFMFGVFLGALIGYKYKNSERNSLAPNKQLVLSYSRWFDLQGYKRKSLSWDSLRYGKKKYILESEVLFKKIKILCIILVRRKNNLEAIKNTWAKNCNKLKFIEVITKKNNLVAVKRTKESAPWVLLCNFLQSTSLNYDWFLIVKDDMFVILENLRYYVAAFNSSEKYYLGHATKFWSTVYNSGQAGYVLSKGTVRSWKNVLDDSGCTMNSYRNREDFYLGKDLSKLNITPIDTRDFEGLSTFHPYNWNQALFPKESYYITSVFPYKCCSQYSITFQAIEGDKMYMYNYLIYGIQIFSSGSLGNKPYVSNITDDQIWKTFLQERGITNFNISREEYYKIWEDLVHDPTSFAAAMKKEIHFDYED